MREPRIHYYTHTPDHGGYGLARIGSGSPLVQRFAAGVWDAAALINRANEGPVWPGKHLMDFVRWRHADRLGITRHPSHALSIMDAPAGADVVTVADLIPWRYPEFLRNLDAKIWAMMQWFRVSRSLKASRRNVAISPTARDDLEAMGFACHAVIPPTMAKTLRRRRTRACKRRGWLIVGENEPSRKRWGNAIQAASQTGDHVTWIGHRIAHSPEAEAYEAGIQHQADALRVPLVRLATAEDDVLAHAYATHRVLIVTSAREGFNLPVVEALYHGLPVVAYDPEGGMDYMRTLFGHTIPIVGSAEEVAAAARYDPHDAFVELDERYRLLDDEHHIESYRRVYDAIGA